MTDFPTDVPIIVPKEMVNDDAYLVTAVLANSGEKVEENQLLVELETSKSSFTLSSPVAGYFYPHYAVGQMLAVGATFGVVAAARRQNDSSTDDPEGGADRPDPRFSRVAWELFRESGLSLGDFKEMSHVKRGDVEAVMAARLPADRRATLDDHIAALASKSDSEKETAVVMLGGGGHSRECIESIELAGFLTIAGILDTRAAPGTMIAGYPVIGDNRTLPRLLEAGIHNLVLAYGIAGNQIERGRHFRELLDLGFLFPTIIHPQAAVNKHVRLGRGVQVMAGSMLGSQAEVGDACIINSNAVVSHDCALDSNVHIAPGAVLAGGVRVGMDSVVGMGATVYMRVRVGSRVIIQNGANVFNDIPDGAEIKGDRGE